MTITHDQKTDMLRHMLGINDPSKPVPVDFYRDYAAMCPGNPLMLAMEADGFVTCYRRAGRGTEYDWWTTTESGKRVALASFRVRQLPKAARRYRNWMCLSDILPDLTFHEYLTSPDYAEHRRNV